MKWWLINIFIFLSSVIFAQQKDTIIYPFATQSDKEYGINNNSNCPASVTIKIPYGYIISTDFIYNIVYSNGDSTNYTTEIKCLTTSKTTGVISGITSGYHYVTTNIGNGSKDSVIYELHLGRNKYGNKCANFFYIPNWTIIVTYDISLPITLSSFTYNCYSNSYSISWITETESNNHFFVIEGSNDGKKWDQIDVVAGNYYSSIPNEYEYFINQKYSFIRLIQVDYNGSITIYDPIVINCNISAPILIYPNPNDNIIYFSIENSDAIIFNPFTTFNVKVSNFQLSIDFLPPGVYFILVQKQIFKIIKF